MDMTHPPETADRRCQFIAAKAAAQGEFLPIVKNRDVEIRSDKGNYKFRYADLQEIQAKTRPALSKHGFATSMPITTDDTGATWIHAVLSHSGGHEERSSLKLMGGENLKMFGAEIKYLRRYLISALLDIDADDDLDENGVDPDSKTRDNGRAPNAPSQVKPASPKRITPTPRAAVQSEPVIPPEPPPPDDMREDRIETVQDMANAAASMQIPDDDPFSNPSKPTVGAAIGEAIAQASKAVNNADTGELATDGERKFLVGYAARKDANLRVLLDNIGLQRIPADTLLGVTKVQWQTIKGGL